MSKCGHILAWAIDLRTYSGCLLSISSPLTEWALLDIRLASKPQLVKGKFGYANGHIFQVYEPLLVVGLDKFANVDIRVRVTGGGHTSQIYAIRQAIAKSLIAYYQKFVDEHSKNMLKQALVQFDRTLLVADNRRCEPKKFGGPGARSRFQKSYR